jgi:hypothetical protein
MASTSFAVASGGGNVPPVKGAGDRRREVRFIIMLLLGSMELED